MYINIYIYTHIDTHILHINTTSMFFKKCLHILIFSISICIFTYCVSVVSALLPNRI